MRTIVSGHSSGQTANRGQPNRARRGIVVADADLVLEGGGVKRTSFQCAAGNIVASLLAAGYSANELAERMNDLDFRSQS
jgi:hypothetical protein